MKDWISVEDKLPLEWKEVLLIIVRLDEIQSETQAWFTQECFVGCLINQKWYCKSLCHNAVSVEDCAASVTHWRALDKFPKI